MLTMDRGLEFQQNLGNIDLPTILLSAASNGYDDLLSLVSQINKALKSVQTGEVIKVAEK